MKNTSDLSMESKELNLAQEWSKQFPISDQTLFSLIMQLKQAIVEQQRHARDVSLLRIAPGDVGESYESIKKYCFLSEYEDNNKVKQGFQQVSMLFQKTGLTEEQKSRIIKAFYILWCDGKGCKCSKGS